MVQELEQKINLNIISLFKRDPTKKSITLCRGEKGFGPNEKYILVEFLNDPGYEDTIRIILGHTDNNAQLIDLDEAGERSEYLLSEFSDIFELLMILFPPQWDFSEE
ncbi:MAG: hypothetical protein M5R37_09335 [Melioribacteraceae bacterium]|nr:hypothetical protein [Melioribacteraceae bacterium]